MHAAGAQQAGSVLSVGHPLREEPLDTRHLAPGKRPIAVIGAGFSGIIAALHLRRRLPADRPLLLCERASDFARLLEPDAGEGDTLLNVRSTNISALADEPHDFTEWLKRRAANETNGIHDTPAGLFPTRRLYARYLRSLLDQAVHLSDGGLLVLDGEVADMTTAERTGFVLICADGSRIEVAGVVLAQDSLPPEEGPHPRICADPWGEKAAAPLDNNAPVLIVGAGLAMVDVAIALRRRGFQGTIVAVSRRGLLPTRHAPAGTWQTPHFTLAEERSLTDLMVRMRDEAFLAAEQNIDWRAVIDSLRPVTAQLWGRLPGAERRRFLRHARRYWDTHRHRMAPPTADQIDAMRADGSLEVVAGRIHGFAPGDTEVQVRYTPRGTDTPQVLNVQRVIIASFLDQIGRTRDRLMQRLLDRGLIRLDANGLGLDVTDGLNVVHDDGTENERIWALGPIVRGVFWECVAVPDIRVQASHAAVSVVARLREEVPKAGFLS